jgi:hypothetical protein
MLSKRDNDLLCRVGRGTPMGELMRQYWMPVVYDWSSSQTARRCACGCWAKT